MAKFTYEIAIPNSGTYEVESDRELTDAQAYKYALQQAGQTTTTPPAPTVKEDTSDWDENKNAIPMIGEDEE